MLTAHQFLNPDLSVLYLGGIITGILKKEGPTTRHELAKKIAVRAREKPRSRLNQTLGYLYIIGRIKYSEELDTVEYLK